MEDKPKALLFTEIEGDHVQLFKGKTLLLEDFESEGYELTTNKKLSPALGDIITSKVLLINDQKVCSLFFSDGNIFDTGVGYRKVKDIDYADWIKERYQRLKKKCSKT